MEVTLGAGNEVSFYNLAGIADVIVDLEGYVASASGGHRALQPPLPRPDL